MKEEITRYLIRRNGNEYFCGKQFALHANYAWTPKATNAKMWIQQLTTVKKFVSKLRKADPNIPVEILTFTVKDLQLILF